MTLHPKTLTKEYMICVLRYWEDQYWYDTQAMQNLDIVQQRAYFVSCIDKSLGSGYRDTFPQGTHVMTAGAGEDTLMTLVRDEFMTHLPLLIRRWDFMHYKQDGGNFAEHMLNCRKASEDTDLKGITPFLVNLGNLIKP
jgi:hypothetical protein